MGKLWECYSTFMVKRMLTSCGSNFRAINYGQINVAPGYEIHVGNNVCLEKGVRLSMGPGAKIYIGDNTYLADYAHVLSVDEVRIGKDCAISWHVLFMDTSSHPIAFGDDVPVTRVTPITVGDHVWIGCRAVILKGVTIGEGAVVANNAVVTHDVPPRTLVGGNPARVIKEGVSWL
ncbi:MAG: acyltransferase [Methylocystaceae bacterium]